jgi:hypothetical protein
MDFTTVTQMTGTTSLSRKADELIRKVDCKADQLLQVHNGINSRDCDNIKARLSFAWGEESRNKEVTAVTAWRYTSARTAYLQVQDINNHLLLPFILAVPPTTSSTPAIKEVLLTLQTDWYKSYCLILGREWKRELQAMALECGFATKSRYLTFMQSLFPEGV